MVAHALLLLVGLVQPPAQSTADVEKALIASQKAMKEAWKTRDAAALGKLLPDNYLEIDPRGRLTKKQVMDDLFPKLTITEYAIQEPKTLMLSPDVAVLTYKCPEKGTFNGKDYQETFMVAATFVKTGGKWVPTVWQMTVLDKMP